MHVKKMVKAKYRVATAVAVTGNLMGGSDETKLVLHHDTGADLCVDGRVVGYCRRSGHVQVKLNGVNKVVTFSNFVH